jgi:hypothetical protein
MSGGWHNILYSSYCFFLQRSLQFPWGLYNLSSEESREGPLWWTISESSYDGAAKLSVEGFEASPSVKLSGSRWSSSSENNRKSTGEQHYLTSLSLHLFAQHDGARETLFSSRIDLIFGIFEPRRCRLLENHKIWLWMNLFILDFGRRKQVTNIAPVDQTTPAEYPSSLCYVPESCDQFRT